MCNSRQWQYHETAKKLEKKRNAFTFTFFPLFKNWVRHVFIYLKARKDLLIIQALKDLSITSLYFRRKGGGHFITHEHSLLSLFVQHFFHLNGRNTLKRPMVKKNENTHLIPNTVRKRSPRTYLARSHNSCN